MRYKKVRVSGVFLAMLLEEGRILSAKTISGLPSGTRFVYSIPDTMHGIWIVVEHESFPELQDGDEIPEFEPRPEFERLE